MHEERETGPCQQAYLDYKTCLVAHKFKLLKCGNVQQLITKCESDNDLLATSVKRAISILESRTVNQWKLA